MPKTLAERFKDWLKRQPDNPEAAELANFLDDDNDSEDAKLRKTEKEPTTVDFTQSPEWKALQKKIADQEAQIASFTKSGTVITAQQALAKLKGKIVPAQKPALLALFTQAAQDDADAAIVTFSVEGQEKPFEGSRVDALFAVFANLGDIKLTEELLDDKEHAAFGAGDGKNKATGPKTDPYTTAANYHAQQMGVAAPTGGK